MNKNWRRYVVEVPKKARLSTIKLYGPGSHMHCEPVCLVGMAVREDDVGAHSMQSRAFRKS